jgi:DNA-binding GntR family transcriptional regulator
MAASTGGSSRRLMKDVAYDHIRERIVDGTFLAGTFISEKDVSAELGMSKTPIRAAFERLAEQGFVTISPQRGVIVRDFSPREIADHYDVRIALERFIVRELAGRLTTDQQDRLLANLEEQESEVRGDVDIQGFTQSDAAFHVMLAAFLGNDEIERVMIYQRHRVQRVVESIFKRDPTVPRCSYEEHRGIADAIFTGDAEAAQQLVERHLQNGKRFLLMGGKYGQG